MGKKAIGRQFRDMGRFTQILSVFFKYGFNYYIESLNLEEKIPFYKKLLPQEEKTSETRPKRLRMAFEELGGAFIKLGQLLSLRPDWIPTQYCEELTKLQDSVRSFPSEQALEIIEKELGAPLAKIFKRFEKNPIAAGSIAQVHRATLKTGEEVVVKVKRPNVEELFATDIDILLYCAKLLKEKFPQDFVDPVEIVHEFERYTTAELDFKIEARNLEFFHQGFLRFPSVRAPMVYSQHSTERVIVMEFLEGQKLSTFAKSDAKIASRKAVLQHLVASTFHQIFVMGHFHADPHPGNILVLENNVVGYIDFGLLGHLTDSMKERMVLLFMSVIEADVDGLVDSLIDIGAAQGDINREAFKQDLIVRLGQFYDLSLRETNIHKLADTILGIARDYRLSIPSNVVMLMKTVVTIESIGEGLYPNFNLISFARPSIKKMIQREFSLSNVRNGFVKKARRLKRTMMVLPEQLYQFLAKLNKGEFKVEFEHKDMSMLVYEMEKTSNKLVFGILTGASIIGAALAMDLPDQALVLGLPFLTFVGFCMAFCFGSLLIYEVVRR